MIMKAINCCKTMEMELTGWKAIVYDITRRMEALPGGEKAKVLANIEDLHMLIAEMDDRIDQIRENCTPETGIDDIRTDRELFNKSLSTLRVTEEEAMRCARVLAMSGLNIISAKYTEVVPDEEGIEQEVEIDGTEAKANFQVGLGLGILLFSNLEIEGQLKYNSHLIEPSLPYNITGLEYGLALNWYLH